MFFWVTRDTEEDGNNSIHVKAGEAEDVSKLTSYSGNPEGYPEVSILIFSVPVLPKTLMQVGRANNG